jgi:butyrate kinase
MEKAFKILTINPGSTSTKVAVFENDKELFAEIEKKVRGAGDKLDLDMKEAYTESDDDDDELFDVKLMDE